MPTARITISFVPKAFAALEQLAKRTGMSKADLVNRAVQLYDFAEQEMGRGCDLILRRPDGTLEQVHFL